MADPVSIMMIGSTILSTAGPIMEGISANRSAKFTAQQERIAGDQAMGAASRDAYFKRREGNLVASRAQAVAAASGGGAADPSVLDVMGGIEGQTEYNVLSALYEGQEIKRQYNAQADLDVFEGKQALKSGIIRGATRGLNAMASPGGQNLLTDSSSLFQKYGQIPKPTRVKTGTGPYSGHGYEPFGYG